MSVNSLYNLNDFGSAAASAASAVSVASASSAGQSLSASGAQAGAQALADSAEVDSFESQLRSAMTTQNQEELKEACTQFEELMLGMLYKSMKATVNRAEITESDPGRDTFEQWQDDAMMKEIAKRGTFGLADMMYKQLSRRMENAYELKDEP